MSTCNTQEQKGYWFAPAHSPSGDLRSGWQLTVREFAVWLTFVLVTLVLVCCHEHWRDEAQGYLLARDLSIPGLFAHMKDESQFILWYLFSWPFVHLLGFNIYMLSIVHWAMSCATAWMFIRYAPFRLLSKTGILFSMAYAFEYTVITRHYQISIFLLIILLVLWKQRYRHPILFACLMAVSASANLPYWGCLSAMCAVILAECIVGRPQPDGQKAHFNRQIIAAMAIVLLGYCLAALEIYNWHGGFGSQQIVEGSEHKVTLEPLRFLHYALYFYGKALILLPNISEETGFDPFIINTGIGVTIFALLYFSRSWRALLFYGINTFVVFGLMYFGQFHSTRHVCFLLIGAVAACWMDTIQRHEDASAGLPQPKPHPLRKTITVCGGILAGGIIAEHFIAFLIFAYMEIRFPFSHGRATAEFIKQNYPKDIMIACYTARQNVPVIAHMPYLFLIFDRYEMGTFSKWRKIESASLIDVSNSIFSVLPKNLKGFLFVASANERPVGLPPNFKEVYSSADHEKKIWSPYGEYFLVFEVLRPELVNMDPNNFKYRAGPAHIFRFPSERDSKLFFH